MAKAVTLQDDAGNNIYPITDISLVGGTIPTNKISNDSVTASKINTNSVSVLERIYYYEQKETSKSNVDVMVPIDFETYREIHISFFYETTATVGWCPIYAKDANNNTIGTHQQGIEASNTATISGINRDGSEVIAFGAGGSACSGGEITLMCGNEVNFPFFNAKAYGGSDNRFQNFSGRIKCNPLVLKRILIRFVSPQNGGWVDARGIKRDS